MFLAPFTPDSDDAQRLAADELAKGMYSDTPSIAERFFQWFGEAVWRVTTTIVPTEGGAGSYIAIFLIISIIGVVIFSALRRSRLGYGSSGRGARTELFDDDRSSKQLFAAANKAENAGDLNLTVVELYRAIIRALDERALITVVPGMTALEAARAGSQRIGAPELFFRCASTFNEIYYWSGQATPDDVQALRALHHQAETAAVSA